MFGERRDGGKPRALKQTVMRVRATDGHITQFLVFPESAASRGCTGLQDVVSSCENSNTCKWLGNWAFPRTSSIGVSRAGVSCVYSRNAARRTVPVPSSNFSSETSGYSSPEFSTPSEYTTPEFSVPEPPAGEKIAKWLGTPFDLLAFGPRSAAGAVVTFNDRIATLQTDVESLVELMQDPRPMDEKSAVIFKEVENRVVECVEKGADVETEVLSNLKMILPAEAANVLSELIPEQPGKAMGMSDMPSSSMDMSTNGMPADMPQVTYSGSDVMADRLVSEVTEIKTANSELNTILDQVRSNTDVAMTNVLLLSLKDARDQLQRRLDEVSPTSLNEPSVASAVREANILLDEINASFF
eukprot:gene23015-30208_t